MLPENSPVRGGSTRAADSAGTGGESRALPPALSEETARLERSWMRHSEEMLRDYMIADSHDPCLNPQSIQGRNFLVAELFGERFAALAREELTFGAALLWLGEFSRQGGDEESWAALEDALSRGSDNAEGQPVPHFLRRIFRRLPCVVDGVRVPNYLQALLAAARATAPDGDARRAAWEAARWTFASLWRDALARIDHPPISVLEPACGSANDYAPMARSGLARHVGYTGFDLCEKNVMNARAAFPGARFDVGNVFAIAHPDKSFDCVIVHDLLEHLSPEGLELAIAELWRVARRGIYLGFFQMHEGSEHVVRPVDEYHWNTLSLPRIRASFERRGAAVQGVHVNSYLRWEIDCAEPVYYDSAYSLFVRFPPD